MSRQYKGMRTLMVIMRMMTIIMRRRMEMKGWNVKTIKNKKHCTNKEEEQWEQSGNHVG